MSVNSSKKYTMQEMADILKVNKTTVYRYLKKERIDPATVVSNTNYYDAMILKRLKNILMFQRIKSIVVNRHMSY